MENYHNHPGTLFYEEYKECFVCGNHITIFKIKNNYFFCRTCQSDFGPSLRQKSKKYINLMIHMLRYQYKQCETLLIYKNEFMDKIYRDITFYEKLKERKLTLRPKNWALLNKNSDDIRIKYVARGILNCLTTKKQQHH